MEDRNIVVVVEDIQNSVGGDIQSFVVVAVEVDNNNIVHQHRQFLMMKNNFRMKQRKDTFDLTSHKEYKNQLVQQVPTSFYPFFPRRVVVVQRVLLILQVLVEES